MITSEEAIVTLYTVARQQPYNSSSSWTRIQEFTQDPIQRKTQYPFVLDERFVTLARPDI